MLIFWNMAGVPLSYCHCTIYLANHDPSMYSHSRLALVLFFTSYLFMYWVWDTGNSQAKFFRAESRGYQVQRKAFPQLPWKKIENPISIQSDSGDAILCDGWYKMARKVCRSPHRRIVIRHPNPTKPLTLLFSPDPLHLRSLLCTHLGPHHRLQLALPLVLPRLFRNHDCPPRHPRYPALPRKVR